MYTYPKTKPIVITNKNLLDELDNDPLVLEPSAIKQKDKHKKITSVQQSKPEINLMIQMLNKINVSTDERVD